MRGAGGLRERRKAFTLIEVLAALTLTAIILPVAMRGISLATATAGEAKRRMEAASLAEGKLAELLVTGDWRRAGLSGDFGEDRPGYGWEAEVADYDEPEVRQLTVSVNWTARSRKRELSLTTLVYDMGE